MQHTKIVSPGNTLHTRECPAIDSETRCAISESSQILKLLERSACRGIRVKTWLIESRSYVSNNGTAHWPRLMGRRIKRFIEGGGYISQTRQETNPQSKQHNPCLPIENQTKGNKWLHNQHYCFHHKLFHKLSYLSSFESQRRFCDLILSRNHVDDLIWSVINVSLLFLLCALT